MVGKRNEERLTGLICVQIKNMSEYNTVMNSYVRHLPPLSSVCTQSIRVNTEMKGKKLNNIILHVPVPHRKAKDSPLPINK